MMMMVMVFLIMMLQVWDGLYEEERRLPEMIQQREELLEAAGIKV